MTEVLAHVLQAVHVHSAGGAQADDITLVLISRRPESAARHHGAAVLQAQQ